MTIQNTTIQDSDKEGFAYLNAIALGEIPPPKFTSDITFWTHERNNPLIGKVVDFSEFEHESTPFKVFLDDNCRFKNDSIQQRITKIYQ